MKKNCDIDLSLNKAPPSNIEAEQSVLGSCLIENSAINIVLPLISKDDFYNDAHKKIFGVIVELSGKNEPVDLPILSNALRNKKLLDSVGGASYIASLVDNIPSAANVAAYAKIVRDKARLRQTASILNEAIIEVYNANGDGAAPILDKLREKMNLIPVDEKRLQVIDAGAWCKEELPAPEQVLEGIFDLGDKVGIIASSKSMKSFFLLQMAISISVGLPFLGWKISKPYKVCLIQFELKKHHNQRRLKNMCRGLEIDPKHLEGRFLILNARGLGLVGPKGIKKIQQAIADFHPDVIFFDPLYKISTGVENAAEDTKVILNAFDGLAEETEAAIVYTHHDPKGSPGDRDIRDRGAGSNVLGRDFDAGITLTQHATDPDVIVVETLLRNYRHQEGFTIKFVEDDERRGYRFEERPDIVPEKKTSKSKPALPPLPIYLPNALSILGKDEMEIAAFKAAFKMQTGLSDHRIRDFLAWATAGGNPHIETREERGGRGRYKKMIKTREGGTREE
jgi:hypothetical protein